MKPDPRYSHRIPPATNPGPTYRICPFEYLPGIFHSVNFCGKTGPVKFESVYEDDEDEATMLELLRGKSGGTTSSSSTSAADLFDLSLAEDRCVKVTKSGAVHVGVLPREDAVMVAAGDKDGRIGLWSIDRTTGAQVNVQVQPHTSYCSGLRWCGESAADLFTCSYDGTCRRLDVSEGVFHEVFVVRGSRV